MKAVVMAGGEGTRLRPLTCGVPKPMVPVGNRPILDHVLGLLARHGVEEAILTLHHRPRVIRDHVGDGSAHNLKATCYIEDVPLGTAGSVKNVAPELDGTFLIISGDVLTTFDLTSMVDFHRRRGAAVTIGLTSVDTPLEYGVVVCDDDGRVRRFVEKPSWGEVMSDQVNTGIYVVEPEVLDLVEPGRVFDFSQHLFPLLLEAGQPLFGFRGEGYWCDVGNLAQYLQAHVDILEGRAGLGVDGEELEERVWVGPGVEIAPGVELRGPLLIGPGSYLGTGAGLEGPAVLGRDVVIGGQASVKRAVIGDRSFVGRLAEVRGAVIGRGVRLGNRTSVFDGSVLADEVRVGEDTVVKSGVKVWPGRSIAPETVLGDSLVWGKTWGYGVFGEAGVEGLVNVELGPEMAARLGAALGSTQDLGASVVVGVDPAAGPRLLRDALASGLALAGSRVWNCGELPAPVVRYAVGCLGAAAGAHVGAAEGDRVVIRLLGPDGLDLSRSAKRRLERALGSDDFRRAPPDRLGDIRHLPGLGEAYLAHIQERGRELGRKGLTVAGAYAHPWFAAHARDFWRALDVTHLAFAEDLAGHPDKLRRFLRAEEAAFAFSLGADGETLRLFDGNGRALDRSQTWLVLSGVAVVREGTPAAVPADLPRAVGEGLAALGAIPLPCAASKAEAMSKMRDLEKDAAPTLFRQSEMVFGGLMAVVGLLDHIADTGETVAEMVDRSPLGEWVHVRVPCPWDAKGRVMRLLLEGAAAGASSSGYGRRAVEGFEAETETGRAVVLPDPDRPAFHVYSEGATMEAAEELAGFFAQRVRELAGLEIDTGIPSPRGQS